ncbi:hypothetical protein Trydic_g1089 [Trypoxylus dichotomus]
MYAYDKCDLVQLPDTVQIVHSRQDMFSIASTVLIISVVIVVSIVVIVDRMRSPQIVEARQIAEQTAGRILHGIEESRRRFRE